MASYACKRVAHANCTSFPKVQFHTSLSLEVWLLLSMAIYYTGFTARYCTYYMMNLADRSIIALWVAVKHQVYFF